MPKTLEERFLDFLKGRLSQDVEVPKAATDVLRTVKFPGLERRSGMEELDMGAFGPGAYSEQGPPQGGMQAPQGGAPPREPGPGLADVPPGGPPGRRSRF